MDSSQSTGCVGEGCSRFYTALTPSAIPERVEDWQKPHFVHCTLQALAAERVEMWNSRKSVHLNAATV